MAGFRKKQAIEEAKQEVGAARGVVPWPVTALKLIQF